MAAKQQALAGCPHDAWHTNTDSLDGKLLQICPIDRLLGSMQLRRGLWVKLLELLRRHLLAGFSGRV